MEDTAASPLLSAAEARVLGCLIEKEATTPDTYPLTVNAAHVAANQKTARDPVMALDLGEVNHALRQLEAKGWPSRCSPRVRSVTNTAPAHFSACRKQQVGAAGTAAAARPADRARIARA